MRKVVHVLFVNEDGCIYCKKINGLIQLVEFRTPCLSCDRFVGTIQGEGCECVWDDFDFENAVCVYDHVAEYDRVNSFKTVPKDEKLKIWQEKNETARIRYENRKWGRPDRSPGPPCEIVLDNDATEQEVYEYLHGKPDEDDM